MPKSNSPISKMEKMMHRMHIDHNKYDSSQRVIPIIFKNQYLNRSSHHHHHHHHHQHQQQQQQDRDSSRFFYKLRQKKKQRRLQHGPLYVRSHHHQHEQEMRTNNHEQKIQSKMVTAIVGSSIARNISVKNIESETDEVRLRFKSGSDCADALAWL